MERATSEPRRCGISTSGPAQIAGCGTIGPRIAAVGTNLEAQGVRDGVIDAHDLLVTLGWISAPWLQRSEAELRANRARTRG